MTMITTRARRGPAAALGSVAAAAALVLAGITPASAAEVPIGPEDIAGFENGDESDEAGYNYDEWHIGNTSNDDFTSADSLDFGECSVTFRPPVDDSFSITQLLKGFPIDGRPDTLEEITAVFESLAVEMEAGSVTLQVPMFIYPPENDEISDRQFTTLRNADAFTEAGTFDLGGAVLTGTQDFDPDEPYTTEDFLEELEEALTRGFEVEILGFGITGTDGSVVNSLSVLGDQFLFGDGDCTPEIPDDDDEDDDDAPQAPTRPVAVETGR